MAQVMKTRGTREEVWNGIARATSGGLVKDDLKKNARGALVSIKQSDAARARYPALKAKLCAAPPACACKGQPCVCQPNAAAQPAAQPAVVAAPAETAAQRAARIFAEDEIAQRNQEATAAAALQQMAQMALDRVVAVAQALPRAAIRDHKRQISELILTVRQVVDGEREPQRIAGPLYEVPAAVRGQFEEALAPLFAYAEVGYQHPPPRAAAPVAAPAPAPEVAQRTRAEEAAAALQQMAQMAQRRVLAAGMAIPRDTIRKHNRQISRFYNSVQDVANTYTPQGGRTIAELLYNLPAEIRGQYEEALAPLFAFAEIGYRPPTAPAPVAAPPAPVDAPPAAVAAVAPVALPPAFVVALQEMEKMARDRVFGAVKRLSAANIRNNAMPIRQLVDVAIEVAAGNLQYTGLIVPLSQIPESVRAGFEGALAPLFKFAETRNQAIALQQMAIMSRDRVYNFVHHLNPSVQKKWRIPLNELTSGLQKVVEGKRNPSTLIGPPPQLPEPLRRPLEEALAPLFNFAGVEYQPLPAEGPARPQPPLLARDVHSLLRTPAEIAADDARDEVRRQDRDQGVRADHWSAARDALIVPRLAEIRAINQAYYRNKAPPQYVAKAISLIEEFQAYGFALYGRRLNDILQRFPEELRAEYVRLFDPVTRPIIEEEDRKDAAYHAWR